MSCGAEVDPGAGRCESCYSQLEGEVRAFRCPRCESVLELGTPQCAKCGMRFKVKAVRPSDTAEDERILEKLISYGKTGPGPSTAMEGRAEPTTVQGLSRDEEDAVREVVGQLSKLASTRGDLASDMAARLSKARDRLARISGSSPTDLPVDDVEAELRSVAEDLAGADELVTSAYRLSHDLARALSLPGVEALAKGKDLRSAAEGLAQKHAGGVPEDILQREEQVRKREEMVDRKIKAYAQKKRQLDEMEAGKARGSSPLTAPQPTQEPSGELAEKVRSLHELVSPDGACDDIGPCLSSLEEHVKELVSAKSALEQRVAQFVEGEDEVRRLLKVLDGLLGQLPSEAVDSFSKSDEFKLYERVLDRLRV